MQWKANTYTIKYNGNGATGGITENSTHTYDVVGYLNNNGFYKDGYRFIGWSTSKNGEVVFKNSQSVLNMTEQNGNTIELYAKWEAIDKESQWMDNVNVPKVYSRFISMQECADGTIPINSLSIHSIWNSPEYYSVLKESLNKKGDDYLKDFVYINERKNGKGK